nr:sigma-E processing peptidase SpoIIGA [Lentibacillus sp. JNUCC-1]
MDAVWLLNFLLDWMLLMLTQTLARDATGRIRVMAGAGVASMLVPITLFFPGSFIATSFGKLIYSVCIVLVAFKYKNIYQTIKKLVLFYFTTFATGGGLVALHFLLKSPIGLSPNGVLTLSEGFGTPISWVFVVLGFPLVWLFTKQRMDRHASEKIRYDQLVPVTVEFRGKQFSTSGYIDSGNQLYDPLTKQPVIICDETFLRKWFTEAEWEMLKQLAKTLDFDAVPIDLKEKLNVIPYQGVEGRSAFLIAVKPDELLVYYHDQILRTKKVFIGIQFADLAHDESYHCLLHPQIIQLATVHSA